MYYVRMCVLLSADKHVRSPVNCLGIAQFGQWDFKINRQFYRLSGTLGTRAIFPFFNTYTYQ